MAELKTKRNKAGVKAFVDAIENDQRCRDCRTVMKMMKEITGRRPEMWGTNIIGYGSYHYRYESGREGDWFLSGLSPRKQNLTLYIMGGFPRHAPLLKRLGKHRTGKACLYINRLEDVDLDVLHELIERSVEYVGKKRD